MTKTFDKDPHADREAANYDSPIPSREFILQLLENHERGLDLTQLAEALDLPDDDNAREALRRRVKAMLRDGQLQEEKRGRLKKMDTSKLIAGRVIANRAGFGFLSPDEGGDDLYLAHYEMRKVFDGDRVLARDISHTGSKSEAEIVEVTERNTHRVVGKLFVEDGKMRVVPESPKILHTIFIDDDGSVNADHEQIVLVEITRQPGGRRPPKGVVSRVLGNEMDPGMEIEIAVHNFNIPHEWPEDVTRQVEDFSDEPTAEEKTDRIDLRDLPLVTIDGEDARDFDDAVHCRRNSDGSWQLWVAIADVSHYVGINTPLDHEAYNRGTSVYFPDYVVPMLPEKLSNGLCSLKPSVDRLCMACEMTLSADGKLNDFKFYEAVMHSHARLTYTEVGRMLEERDDPESPLRSHYAPIVSQLDDMHALFKVLRKRRKIRGAMDFETTETKVIFNEERKIENIVPVVRNDAHKLIEEFMLCANVATARFLEKNGQPILYRVHEGPTENRLTNLRAFLGELGLSLGGGEEPGPSDYLALADQIEDRADFHVIQTMMLRSMQQAVYQPENKGHFGLAYDAYAHFTSPIRRYPDLLVHRAIRHALATESSNPHICRSPATPVSNPPYPYDMGLMVQMGEQCSVAERRADEATRDVMNWLKCEYLQEHLGSQFEAVITSVAPFGFFAELCDLYVEGLVHVSELGKEFFEFDAAKQRLIGEHSRTVYHIGDVVKVLVSRIELGERKIHLSLVNPPGGKKAAEGGKKKSSGKKSRSRSRKR